MSEWGELFAKLSQASDTLDTIRHSDAAPLCEDAANGSSPIEHCCECGLPIADELETWWGTERCHRACGEAAFRREKARGAYLGTKGAA